MDVEVSVDETPGETPVAPVVVVESESEATLPTVIDLVERMTRLEGRMDAVESVAANAQATADFAEVSANDAGSLAIDALVTADNAAEIAEQAAEVAVETANETGVLPEVFAEVDADLIEPDETPKKTHWLYRDLNEWKAAMAKS